MLDIREITKLTELEQHREDWERLLDTASNSEFFQTYEWLRTWLETFWADKPIAFQLISQHGQLVAMAPLLLDDRGDLKCPGSLAFPVNAHAKRTDMTCAASPRHVLSALLDRLQKTHHPLRLSLQNVEMNSPVSQVLEETARSAGLRVLIQGMPASALVRIDSDWERYLESRSPHTRREMKRKRNKLDRAGLVDVRPVTEAAHCDSALDDVFQIERRTWKERSGTSLTTEAGADRFYAELARRCAERGWLRIYLLYLEGQPVAHIFGILYKNEYYALKTSYDESYRELSPGAVLFSYALEDAFSQGWSAFDFLGEESRWKNELATTARRYVSFCAFPPGAYRCRWCRTYQQKVKPFVKANIPAAVTLKRKLSGRFKSRAR